MFQAPGHNHGERHGFEFVPFIVSYDKLLRGIFVTGHYGVCQNMTGRSQRFQPSRGNVWQFRPFFIGYYLIARTKVKVETSHFDLPMDRKILRHRFLPCRSGG
jgi:hypothetical protein